MAQGILFFVLGLALLSVVALKNRPVAKPLMAGFLARGAFVFADVTVLRYSSTMDGAGWDLHARYMAQRGLDHILGELETGHNLFKGWMALLYSVFGHSSAMVQMINATLGALVVVLVWRIALLLNGDEKASLIAAWVVALNPSAILHSGLLLREVAVTFPLIVGVYHLVVWHRGRSLKNAAYAGVALMVSMAFHSGTYAVLVGLALWSLGSWVRALLSGRLRLLAKNTVALALVGSAVAFAANTGWGMQKFSQVETDDADALTASLRHQSAGRTAYLDDLEANTPMDLVTQAPLRVTYFLFAPFPWMLQTSRDALGVIDALLFLWLVGRLVRYHEFPRRNASALLVVAVFSVMALTFAMGVSNYGTAMRHRAKMLPMLIAVSLAFSPRRAGRPGEATGSTGSRPPWAQATTLPRGMRGELRAPIRS